MKGRIAAIILSVLAAGAAGATGAALVNSHADTPAKQVSASPQSGRVAVFRQDPCSQLARKLSGGTITDRHIRRLVRSHPRCKAAVVRTKVGGGPAGKDAPRIVTLPNPAGVTAAAAAPSAGSNSEGDDDSYEHENESSEHESEDD